MKILAPLLLVLAFSVTAQASEPTVLAECNMRVMVSQFNALATYVITEDAEGLLATYKLAAAMPDGTLIEEGGETRGVTTDPWSEAEIVGDARARELVEIAGLKLETVKQGTSYTIKSEDGNAGFIFILADAEGVELAKVGGFESFTTTICEK